MMSKSNSLKVFTDGAARGNPGPGGWGAIVATDYQVKELGSGEKHTTNNRMELKAVIEALNYISKSKTDSVVEIFTDSKYVMNGARSWIKEWKKNNWKTKAKKDVLNKDLWESFLEEASDKKILWHLLPGHSGIPANERCDEIATAFADGGKVKLFSGNLESYHVDLTSIKPTKSKPKKKSSSKSSPAYSYLSLINGGIEIHHSWNDCEKRVKGVSGAKFKKALSKEDEKNIILEWRKSLNS